MMYLVKWEIDIDAESPEQAATQALIIQRDPYSTANCFKVKEHGETGFRFVDLGEGPFNFLRDVCLAGNPAIDGKCGDKECVCGGI